VKHSPENPKVYSLVPAMLQLISAAKAMSTASSTYIATDRKSIIDRASSIYSNRLCRVSKFASDIDVEHLDAAVAELRQQAEKCSEPLKLSLISSGMLFLCKALISTQSEAVAPKKKSGKTPSKKRKGSKSDKSAVSTPEDILSLTVGECKVVDLYSGLLESFLSKKRCLNTRFFLDFPNKFPELGWCLSPKVCSLATEAESEFLRGEAFLIIAQIASFRGALTTRLNDDKDAITSFFSLFVPHYGAAVVKSFQGGLLKPAKLKLCLKATTSVYNTVSRCSEDAVSLFPVDDIVAAILAYVADNEKQVAQVKNAIAATARSMGVLEKLGEQFAPKKQEKRKKSENNGKSSKKTKVEDVKEKKAKRSRDVEEEDGDEVAATEEKPKKEKKEKKEKKAKKTKKVKKNE